MVYSVKIGKKDALFCRILDVAVGIRNRQQQLALFTAERRGALRLSVGFSKTCFKHTPVWIKGNDFHVVKFVDLNCIC